MRTIKFRRAFFFDEEKTKFSHFAEWGVDINGASFTSPSSNNFALYHEDNQFTERHDKNGKDIYDGDILIFSDKIEWYRGKYWAKVAVGIMTKQEALDEIERLPNYKQVVELPESYNFLSGDEIQQYWEIVGNIYENPLLKK